MAPCTGRELAYMQQAMQNGKLCGDGPFTKKCSEWMCTNFQAKHCLLTTSCTHALEMAAYLSDIQPGDEVIMPLPWYITQGWPVPWMKFWQLRKNII